MFTPEQISEVIKRAHIASKERHLSRIKGPRPKSPQELGYFAELCVALKFGGAVWGTLPLSLRRRIHGGHGGVTAADRGVDVVLPDLTLIQVKYYADGNRISADAVHRINNIADATRKGFSLGAKPRMLMVYRRGAKFPNSTPNAEEVEQIPLSDGEFGFDGIEWQAESRATEQKSEDVVGDLCLDFDRLASEKPPAPDFDRFQLEVTTRARELVAAGQSLVRIQLPVATGKSYVVADLAGDYAGDASPVILIAPRAEIVIELAALISERGCWRRVLKVVDGSPWPFDATGGDIIVATGQSLNSRLSESVRCKAAALFVDEAHHREGHECAQIAVDAGVRFDLSACLRGKVDILVEHRRAIELGLICAAEFVFAVFPRRPTFEDLAAHLAAHPGHAGVLACFQTRVAAHAFAAACDRAGAGPAAPYVTGEADPEMLEGFKRGRVRVLCVVGKIEMGVNIHRCDTVLLVEPWDSWRRTLQLIGRGTRLFPTKNGFFTVLCGVCPEDVVERRVARLVETLHAECAGFDPETFEDVEDFVEVIEGGGVVPQDEEEEMPAVEIPVDVADVIAAVRREVYDACGRRIADPLYKLQRRYSEAHALVAQASPRPESYDAYMAWRTGLGEKEIAALPTNPADDFGALPGGFSWDAFLDRPPPPPDLARIASAAFDEAVAKEIINESELRDSPNEALYATIRTQTKIGITLPVNPLRPGETWAEFFARI